MKNFLLIVCSVFFFSNCAVDQDPTSPAEQTTTTTLFTITTPANFTENKMHAFLTDENGDLIVDENIEIGSTVDLIAEFDPVNRYDLTLVQYIDGTSTSLTLSTFTDIKPFHFIYETRNFSEQYQGELYIEKGGYNIESWGSVPFTEEGDYFKFTNNMGSVPDHFFISFKNAGENGIRHYLKRNVTESFTDTITMSEATQSFDFSLMQYPDNEFHNFQLFGSFLDTPDASVRIGSGSNSGGSNEIMLNFPKNVFETHRMYGSSGNGVKTRFLDRRFENIVDPIFEFSNLEIELLLDDPENYDFNHQGNPDFYYHQFKDIALDNSTLVTWTLYGQGSPKLKSTVPKIDDFIQGIIPDYNRANLSAKKAVLYKYDLLENYEDFICTQLQFGCQADKNWKREELFQLNF